MDLRSTAEWWISQHQKADPLIFPDCPWYLRFDWLYAHGFLKKCARGEGGAEAVALFEANRESWRSELTEHVAASREHLAVVLLMRTVFARSIWGIDLERVRRSHGRWMADLMEKAGSYDLRVATSFTHYFDEVLS